MIGLPVDFQSTEQEVQPRPFTCIHVFILIFFAFLLSFCFLFFTPSLSLLTKRTQSLRQLLSCPLYLCLLLLLLFFFSSLSSPPLFGEFNLKSLTRPSRFSLWLSHSLAHLTNGFNRIRPQGMKKAKSHAYS